MTEDNDKRYLPADLGALDHVAGAAVASNLYKLNQAGAFMQLLAGRDLGISPTAALTGIYIVKGKPQISGVTLRALVQASKRFGYRVRETTDQAATMDFFEYDVSSGNGREAIGSVSFTLDDAKRAGLLPAKSDSPWVKYPRAMLLNRATSEGVRAFCPSVTLGAPVYVEGELDDSPAPPVQVAAEVVKTVRNESQGSAPSPQTELVDDRQTEHNRQADAIVSRIKREAQGMSASDAMRVNGSLELLGKQGWPIDGLLALLGRVEDASAPEPEPEAAAEPAFGGGEVR